MTPTGPSSSPALSTTGPTTGSRSRGLPPERGSAASALATGAGTPPPTSSFATVRSATPPPPAAPWSALVSAALLGTERRTPPVAVRPGRSAAAALLDAAAVSTVRRRAALRPAPAADRPAPAPDDPRPVIPPAARRRLALLLADRGGTGGSNRRGTAPDLTELLPQWLAAAGAHGYRAPEALLPALLDAARARTDLRPAALALAGPRARWLARLNSDWKFALRGTGGPATPGADAPEAVRRLWDEGLFAERVALLTSVRRSAPDAGRELLAGSWATEHAEDRLLFLDTLREGLSPADEPFLERALSDRSRTVRATAAELLSTLPASAFATRMAARAHACVVLSPGAAPRAARHGQAGPVLVVTPPGNCDEDMRRDGVAAKAPTGRGERAWWLAQLLESAPLHRWSERFGGRTPQEIAALPVADGWRTELHDAWCRAAVRQRDAAWARALLGAPGAAPEDPEGAPCGSSRDTAKLLTVLPPEERACWVAGFIAAHGLADAFRMLGVCAVPWSEPLGRAVVDALDIARDAGSYPWSFSGVMGLAERCLDPSAADRLDMLTAVTDEPEGASPGSGGYWSEAFQRLVGTLRLRATMLAELTDTSGTSSDNAAPGHAPGSAVPVPGPGPDSAASPSPRTE